MCPLPLAHKAPQRLLGPPKPLSDTLVITWYPPNNFGLQYPSSNIPIFTSGPFRSSSSCPGSHPGLRTTFGNHCWKYALEAIINRLLLYFLVHDNRLLSMLELY